MIAAERILSRLDGVRQTGPDQWMARCSAHDDRSPSVSVKNDDGKALVNCFAGCETGDVLNAIGLSLGDLYDEPLAHQVSPLTRHKRKRHGQALEALRALKHEIYVVFSLAEQMHAGYALDPSDRDRLKTVIKRVQTALEVAG